MGQLTLDIIPTRLKHSLCLNLININFEETDPVPPRNKQRQTKKVTQHLQNVNKEYQILPLHGEYLLLGRQKFVLPLQAKKVSQLLRVIHGSRFPYRM
jgi:hypothetical protein